MKRMTLFVAALSLFAAGSILLAEDAVPKDAAPKKEKAVKQLTKADNGKTVEIAVGKPFDVVLRGNPTTGFQWQVEKIKGDAVVQKGKAEYVVDKHPDRMVGVGGTYTFHFDVKKAGKTKLRFVNIRSWEKGQKPVETFEAVIESK